MTEQGITTAELERVSAENHVWLDVLDNAANVANRLDLLAILLTDADLNINDNAKDGLCSMLQDASETIRDLSRMVQEAQE